jgi:hypothetical protein
MLSMVVVARELTVSGGTMSCRLIALVSVLVLSACGGGGPLLIVDLTTDLRPDVDFTRVRTEVSEEPFAGGPLHLSQLDHPVERGETYGDSVRIAELPLMHAGTWYVRVGLLDASGRIRGQRLASVEVHGPRAITIVLAAGCRGVVCPGGGDDPSASACVNGSCVLPSCLPEAPETCGGVSCDADDDCAPGRACQTPVCRAGSCLLLDGCEAGQICGDAGCVAAPSCGDGACDPGTETACACEGDCGACPAECTDGVCGGDESPSDCPEDCGPPPPTCGDGVCEAGEACPGDCMSVPVPPRCGDPGCTTCEECDLCCDVGCGDGTCAAGENVDCGCPADCGACSTCGDGRCDQGEDCPDDCASATAICRDGVCLDGMGESCGNCQDDCGWCGFGLPRVPSDRQCIGPSGRGEGETCGDLDFAWTNAGVNIAYYPMQVGPAATPLISGDTWGGGRGLTIAMLDPLTKVGVQSTRNPGCLDTPPLRPAIDGWVFGYVRAAAGARSSYGWMRMADLILDQGLGSECARGPGGDEFQVAKNPYSRNPTCEPLECPGQRRCRDANPTGEGAGDCGGHSVRYERRVNAETLELRYAPAGTARRYLHRDDRVRVLYEGGRAGWVFVYLLTTAAPDLTPVGARGWVESSYLAE